MVSTHCCLGYDVLIPRILWSRRRAVVRRTPGVLGLKISDGGGHTAADVGCRVSRGGELLLARDTTWNPSVAHECYYYYRRRYCGVRVVNNYIMCVLSNYPVMRMLEDNASKRSLKMWF